MKKKICQYSLLSLIIATYGCGSSSNGSSNGSGLNSPLSIQPTQATAKPEMLISGIKTPPKHTPRPNAKIQAELNKVLSETNGFRAKKGLPPLTMNANLSAYAQIRSAEISKKFDHKRLDNSSPLDEKYFTKLDGRAENIAKGQKTAIAVAQKWRDSPSHYASMVNKDYTSVGIGYYYDTNTKKNYWTQIFSSGNLESIYNFIAPINVSGVETAIEKNTQYNNNKLTIAGKKRSDGTQIIKLNGHDIIMQPMNNGQSYHAFGELRASSNRVPEAYINIGKSITPTAGLKAHYEGKAIGDFGQHSRTIADVTADVDFSSKKRLDLKVTNGKLSNGLSGNNASFKADNKLNFNDTLNWNASKKLFESNNGKARLYGDNAQELGGQFERKINNEAYRGAYGAKRK